MNRSGSILNGFAGLCVLTGAALLPAGCPQHGGDLPGKVVDVSLKEFSVTPEVATVPAGVITFRVKNDGAEAHELLVVKTNLAPNALPTETNGAYQEMGPGTELIDEIEEFAPGQTQTLTLTLNAGGYVLLCNLVDEEAHYSQGMFVGFTVTSGQ